MNIFKDFLHDIFDGYDGVENKTFIGRTMIARLDDDLRVKVSVDTWNVHEMYELVLVKIINRVGGEVDRHGFAFKNYFGNRICHTFFNETYEWEHQKPIGKQIENLASDVRQYIDMFKV